MEDHYATLQVESGATAQEIERAYRRLARANHPDSLRDVSVETRHRAGEVLKRVNRAHGVLGDRERRRAYDRERATRSPVPASPRRAAPAAPRAQSGPEEPTVADGASHRSESGPINIDWTTPPPRPPRPDTDIFTIRRLVWGIVIIVAFTLLLMLLWSPTGGQPLPTPIPPPHS